jgi:hypothetical protein
MLRSPSTLVLALLALPRLAAAAPGTLPVSGWLADDDGNPLAGDVALGIAIYDAIDAVDAIWEDSLIVDVDAGFFTAYAGVGTGGPVDLSLFAEHDSLWLGFTVDGGEELSPRLVIATAPFAAFAEYAGVADDALSLGGAAASAYQLAADDADTLAGLLCQDGEFPQYDQGAWTCAGVTVGETDPVYAASDAAFVTAAAISDWDEAYGWGDHADAGYVTAETDPLFAASAAAALQAAQIASWNTAYGWGNHAAAGYLISESDPAFSASPAAGISATQITGWNAAYGWGNHASAGYLTSEVDGSTTNEKITSASLIGTTLTLVEGGVASQVNLSSLQDGNTTYTAGTGLSLVSGQFSVNTNTIQARVNNACTVGSSIRSIDDAGTVTCETDDDTTYTAGTGLSLASGQFSVNTATIQARVATSCGAGNSIRAIDSSGTVTCEPDDNTAYAAGTGLSLVGTAFSVTTTGRIGNVSPNASGSSISDQQAHWVGARFRIDGGGPSGRLEFSPDGGTTWGTVCDDSFDANHNAARVVCRSMGYVDGTVVLNSATVDGTGTIFLDDFQCDDRAQSIFDCRIQTIAVTNCSHTEDVGVSCS